MNWNSMLRAAFASIFNWRMITKELLGIGILWGSYLLMGTLVAVPDAPESAKRFADLMPILFWAGVIMSSISFVAASFRSALLAAIAWLAIAPLYFSGQIAAAWGALLIANVGVALYAVGFTLRGGRAVRN